MRTLIFNSPEMPPIKEGQRGVTSLAIVAALAVITSGLIISALALQNSNPFTSESQAVDKTQEFVLPPSVPNNDIKSTVYDPVGSNTWDGIINGDLCFNVNPPSANGRYRAEVVMNVKESPSSTVVKEKTIGASVNHILTSPSTARCASSNSRNVVFAAAFNLPDRNLWADACPVLKILITTSGPWKSTPQEEIAQISKDYLCPGGAPTTAPTIPTSPTLIPTLPFPTAQPTQTRGAIEGTVTVYSCQNPTDTSIEVCDSEAGTNCKFYHLSSKPRANTLWHVSTTQDNTQIFRYKITEKPNGEPLNIGDVLYIKQATSRIRSLNRKNETFTSVAEDKTRVVAGKLSLSVTNTLQGDSTHDLTIDAKNSTCSCTYKATAFVRDARTGEYIDLKHSKFGISNDMSIQKFGDKPTLLFKDGKISLTANLFDYADRYVDSPTFGFSQYGIDGLAHIRLYTPDKGFEVVRQECYSEGTIHACGFNANDTYKYSLRSDSKDIENIRVTCGANVVYGWYVNFDKSAVEKDPAAPGGGSGSGSGGGSGNPGGGDDPGNPGGGDDPDPGNPDPRDPDEPEKDPIVIKHEALLTEREGFGRNVTGGQDGRIIHVTRHSDDKDNPEVGSLRWALEKEANGSSIIVFDTNGTINLEAPIFVPSNTTVDGRGSNIQIREYGLRIKDARNVIITNLTFVGEKETHSDAIEIRDSDVVWVHHVTITNYGDGAIDIVDRSTDITVSWSRITNQKKVMLIGSSDTKVDDNVQNVTLHHNVFSQNETRMPLLRHGKADLYNNYFYDWKGNVIDVQFKAQVLIFSNIFEEPKDDHRITNYGDKDSKDAEGFGQLDDNLVLGYQQVTLEENKPENTFRRPYRIILDAATEDLKSMLNNEAGALHNSLFTFNTFNVKNADIDRNGVINTADLTVCIEQYASDTSECDINNDGVVDSTDFTVVVDFLGVGE